MAISAFKTFVAGEVLTAADLNSSFAQVFDNGEDLAWPATKAKDLNGQELILDVDADTSITADTDDQIDFRIAAQDLVSFVDGVYTLSDLDAGGALGPVLSLYRNSASPVSTDFGGVLRFDGKDNAGNQDTYAALAMQIDGTANGAEEGTLLVQIMDSGTLTTYLDISGSFMVYGAPLLQRHRWLNTTASSALHHELSAGSSADASVRWQTDGTNRYAAGYDATDGTWALCTGGTLGTTNNIVATSTGELTFPRQPAFLAENSSQDDNVTGNGAVATVEFDAEVFDQNADYNNTTDTFTAPVTGRYLLCSNVQISGLVSATEAKITLTTSNRNYVHRTSNPPDTTKTMTVAHVCDMDAADTAKVTCTVSGMGGDTVDINGGGQDATYFSGVLVA
jgi:hypothetical protein